MNITERIKAGQAFHILTTGQRTDDTRTRYSMRVLVKEGGALRDVTQDVGRAMNAPTGQGGEIKATLDRNTSRTAWLKTWLDDTTPFGTPSATVWEVR